MFEAFGFLMKGFILFWISIIASIPNAFMGGLTLCIAATVLTYFIKKNSQQS